MELTEEILEKNGFQTNHPDYVLKRYALHGNNPEWNISLERKYIPTTNILGFGLCCWKDTNNKGQYKNVQMGVLRTVEELNKALELCEIDIVVKE